MSVKVLGGVNAFCKIKISSLILKIFTKSNICANKLGAETRLPRDTP